MTTINVDEFVYKSRSGRYRFRLAHELGHLVLHGEVYKKFEHNTIDEWLETITRIPEKEYGWLEWQAYEFAGLVLGPAGHLVDRFQKLAAQAESVGLSIADATDAVKHRIAQAIGEEFKVSSQVIDKRIQRERLWPLDAVFLVSSPLKNALDSCGILRREINQRGRNHADGTKTTGRTGGVGGDERLATISGASFL